MRCSRFAICSQSVAVSASCRFRCWVTARVGSACAVPVGRRFGCIRRRRSLVVRRRDKRQLALPPEITIDPAALSDSDRERDGVARLTDSPAEAVAALDGSEAMRRILGDPAVDMVVAVRRLEQERYGDLAPEQLADKFRMAWSL